MSLAPKELHSDTGWRGSTKGMDGLGDEMSCFFLPMLDSVAH